jgi:hypothetical protein
MTLLSALEDLRETTLKAVTGCLRALEYISGLRDRKRGYDHWGLAQVHGDSAASKALAMAHRSTLSRVLAMPFRKLVRDAEKSGELAGIEPVTYTEQLAAHATELLPPEPGAGSARHLSSVLHALSSLLKNPKPDATPPTE